ncbi:MAG TPA: NAD(P)-dependent alcohol dehydrogenase [Aggregatilineaceae bacterium]|nr:NAD(P)-dependent alcohol dehydrogenase [Aggregatilineaceae bacterium]
MKAVIYTQYGGPEVLRLTDVPKPTPKANEILIRSYASTAAAAETMSRQGKSIIGRLILGIRGPRKRYQLLGMEFAGEVESVGKDVKRYRAGDQVYGFTGFHLGAYAEYVCMPEKGSLALKPATLTYEEAAAMVDGATTALFFLKDKGQIQRGHKVLIIGASGSIGTFAVQLAKYFGADVTGVCSTTNVDLVKSLGAYHVIDYTREDFTQNGETYDIIFDTVGKSSFAQCKGSLTGNGRYLVTNGAIVMNFLLTWWTSIIGGKRMIFGFSIEKAKALVFIRELVEAGKLKPVIDRCYPLEHIAEAHRYVDTGHKKGNVVITIAGGKA